jgi:hypothetical protein
MTDRPKLSLSILFAACIARQEREEAIFFLSGSILQVGALGLVGRRMQEAREALARGTLT